MRKARASDSIVSSASVDKIMKLMLCWHVPDASTYDIRLRLQEQYYVHTFLILTLKVEREERHAFLIIYACILTVEGWTRTSRKTFLTQVLYIYLYSFLIGMKSLFYYSNFNFRPFFGEIVKICISLISKGDLGEQYKDILCTKIEFRGAYLLTLRTCSK